MTFSEYWRNFKKLTGAAGPYEMALCFYQWLFENDKITLEERNTRFDEIYTQAGW